MQRLPLNQWLLKKSKSPPNRLGSDSQFERTRVVGTFLVFERCPWEGPYGKMNIDLSVVALTLISTSHVLVRTCVIMGILGSLFGIPMLTVSW